MLDIDDNKIIIDSKLIRDSDKQTINLYIQMSLALELMNSKEFEVVNNNIIKDRIFFEISTDYPNVLPENVGILFFNIDKNFNVDIKEYNYTYHPEKRFFHINLEKR